jgi:hypothetical protein
LLINLKKVHFPTLDVLSTLPFPENPAGKHCLETFKEQNFSLAFP